MSYIKLFDILIIGESMKKKSKENKVKDTKDLEIDKKEEVKEEKVKKQKKVKTKEEKELTKEKVLIAVTISFFILICIGIVVYLYFANWHYGTILVQAMKSEIPYYDTYGNEYILNQDPINNDLYRPLKYSFLDFDNDGKSELVTYIAEQRGNSYYLIFRYNFDEEKVYGYLIDSNDFHGLRKDGTVATTGRDGLFRYYDIIFEGNTMLFKDEAVHRASENYYNVYGDDVYKDMFDEYVQNWMKRESAEWEYDLVN